MLLYTLVLGITLAYFLLPKLYQLFIEDSSSKQNKWLDDIAAEADKNRHFFQRGNYLEEEIQPFTEKLKQGENLSETEQLELDGMVKELRDAQLRVRYHALGVSNLNFQKPRGRIFEEQRRIWDEHDNDACRKGKDECADICNGCCRRSCGCCTKPRGYNKKGSAIYQHCTLACGCCVRYHGYYPGCNGIPMEWVKGRGELRPGLALTPLGHGENRMVLKRDDEGHWGLLDS